MSHAAKNAYVLTKPDARRYWLRAQRLDSFAPFGADAQATRATIEHLGYVQIDTIHVIERSHHHILYTRIPEYRREHLRRAQTVDKSIFEYWAHALAYLPVGDMRFFTGAMRNYWKRRALSSVKPGDLAKVLRRIRTDGAVSLRDIDDDVLVEKDHAWASRKPSEKALTLAFYGGQITVRERLGILKAYDLTTRHFGWDRLPRPASETETLEYLLDRALRSQALVSLDSICYLDAPRKPSMRRLIERRVRRGELVRVNFEEAGKTEHWARPELLEAERPDIGGLVHILSPFDPLVIQRKRLKLFFDYEHCFEAYLPREKRRFGYFALPVLVGDEIAAAIDLKTDRERGKLLIRQWTWRGKNSRRTHRAAIEAALHRFERFQLER